MPIFPRMFRPRTVAERVIIAAVKDPRIGYYAKPNVVKIATFFHSKAEDTRILSHRLAYYNSYPATVHLERKLTGSGPGEYIKEPGFDTVTLYGRKSRGDGGDPEYLMEEGSEFARFVWNGKEEGTLTAVVILSAPKGSRESHDLLYEEELMSVCGFPGYLCPCHHG